MLTSATIAIRRYAVSLNLTVTIEGKPRPWWRPLGLRALRRWYRHSRRERHGRLFSILAALIIARLEFRVGSKVIA
jgi:hypothetical protein